MYGFFGNFPIFFLNLPFFFSSTTKKKMSLNNNNNNNNGFQLIDPNLLPLPPSSPNANTFRPIGIECFNASPQNQHTYDYFASIASIANRSSIQSLICSSVDHSISSSSSSSSSNSVNSPSNTNKRQREENEEYSFVKKQTIENIQDELNVVKNEMKEANGKIERLFTALGNASIVQEQLISLLLKFSKNDAMEMDNAVVVSTPLPLPPDTARAETPALLTILEWWPIVSTSSSPDALHSFDEILLLSKKKQNQTLDGHEKTLWDQLCSVLKNYAAAAADSNAETELKIVPNHGEFKGLFCPMWIPQKNKTVQQFIKQWMSSVHNFYDIPATLRDIQDDLKHIFWNKFLAKKDANSFNNIVKQDVSIEKIKQELDTAHSEDMFSYLSFLASSPNAFLISFLLLSGSLYRYHSETIAGKKLYHVASWPFSLAIKKNQQITSPDLKTGCSSFYSFLTFHLVSIECLYHLLIPKSIVQNWKAVDIKRDFKIIACALGFQPLNDDKESAACESKLKYDDDEKNECSDVYCLNWYNLFCLQRAFCFIWNGIFFFLLFSFFFK